MRRKQALLWIGIFAFVLIPFLLWDESILAWTHGFLSRREAKTVVGTVLAGLLVADIVLPVPSSLVIAAAAVILGLGMGTAVSWVGLTIGCVMGYALGRSSGERLLGADDIERMRASHMKLGSWMVFLLRGVPVLAEASVIYAGIIRMPLARFLALTCAANLAVAAGFGLAAYYGISTQE
jgi:uncharacterized membrane protein YdjX (TVP38/TMEM64 family)